MKNLLQQFSAAIIALVAFTLIMSYTRPATDEPKQYIVIVGTNDGDKFGTTVTEKIAEGWHPQGGIIALPSGRFTQAMVK